jgi:hypothetical protein
MINKMHTLVIRLIKQKLEMPVQYVILVLTIGVETRVPFRSCFFVTVPNCDRLTSPIRMSIRNKHTSVTEASETDSDRETAKRKLITLGIEPRIF